MYNTLHVINRMLINAIDQITRRSTWTRRNQSSLETSGRLPHNFCWQSYQFSRTKNVATEYITILHSHGGKHGDLSVVKEHQ